MDLIFIRKLRDIDGLNVVCDPAIEINLMYQNERNLHFQREEEGREIPKKKGPREILNPEKMTVNRAEQSGSFDKEEFRAKIFKSLKAAKIIFEEPELATIAGRSESETNVAPS